MDLYCGKCGEPMEMDMLHEEAAERYEVKFNATYREDAEDNRKVALSRYEALFANVRKDWAARGCPAITGMAHNPEVNRAVADASSAMSDILGDDIDGIAAMMEDFVG